MAAAAFGQSSEVPKPTPVPKPTLEELNKQVHEKDIEIARLNSLAKALREQMSALSAYFLASERVRHIDEAVPFTPLAISTAESAPRAPDPK